MTIHQSAPADADNQKGLGRPGTAEAGAVPHSFQSDSYATAEKPAAALVAQPAAGEVSVNRRFAQQELKVIRRLDQERILTALRDKAKEFEELASKDNRKHPAASGCCRKEQFALLDLHDMISRGFLYLSKDEL